MHAIYYDTHVDLPYDPLWLAADWAKEHCKRYITNKVADAPAGSGIHIRYYFSDAKDATAFRLRWL